MTNPLEGFSQNEETWFKAGEIASEFAAAGSRDAKIEILTRELGLDEKAAGAMILELADTDHEELIKKLQSSLESGAESKAA